MKQIQIDSAVSPEEALDITERTAQIIHVTRGDADAYIRKSPENDHRDGYQVNMNVEIIRERHTIVIEDAEKLQNAIRQAETARLVSPSETPWSALEE